ncbi:hypothetical protein EYF80_000347 [Liparis tanakae]|uniref:Uncharacterized protein n=1 Tax=Liparis tanakae TaxID=230148 RepID=A0A4Z2JFM3_9TELE|nr:hypothetical protein EYF80_000347 [Liparis tanakae]
MQGEQGSFNDDKTGLVDTGWDREPDMGGAASRGRVCVWCMSGGRRGAGPAAMSRPAGHVSATRGRHPGPVSGREGEREGQREGGREREGGSQMNSKDS